MIPDAEAIYLALLVGLAGWTLRHTVDRKIHLNGRRYTTQDVCDERFRSLDARMGHIQAQVDKLVERLLDDGTDRLA